ncbi:hypothetical protein HNY73_005464 [Argiope bruennichi]|uniref:Uncharacterized protein n=1 Tax=Argiope bruennichi TaxID=94029 RepID=A0A8T0FJ78_ARGBR|nr:hypothetical protein HNY73_005464 [Argiope bruennichi]
MIAASSTGENVNSEFIWQGGRFLKKQIFFRKQKQALLFSEIIIVFQCTNGLNEVFKLLKCALNLMKSEQEF